MMGRRRATPIWAVAWRAVAWLPVARLAVAWLPVAWRDGARLAVARLAVARFAVTVLVAVLVAGCSAISPAGSPHGTSAGTGAPSGSGGTDPLLDRIDLIETAVARWRAATGIDAAKAAAEEARNLVVGPYGPGYGDADGNGTIAGAVGAGLLPGLGGEAGLAQPAAGPCVVRDVLGGDWSDPAARWSTLLDAISAWSPTNNTFPALPSHPQRLVGWATLTLATDDLAAALEFGGHAQLHADVSRRAVTACDA